MLSVDTKKKELVGEFKNGGREWQPKGRPEAVNVHDFLSQAVGKAIPYGIYDVSRNSGWVSIGIDHDTASFAVETLRRWWLAEGRSTYPDARRMLICADGGGSNDYRSRLWKVELARFARETGLEITVCHLPPGTSKWNKIEHRMFAHISMNWRGRPLTSHEAVIELIGSVTTRQGLRIHAELDPGAYPTGLKVSDAELAAVPLCPGRSPPACPRPRSLTTDRDAEPLDLHATPGEVPDARRRLGDATRHTSSRRRPGAARRRVSCPLWPGSMSTRRGWTSCALWPAAPTGWLGSPWSVCCAATAFRWRRRASLARGVRWAGRRPTAAAGSRRRRWCSTQGCGSRSQRLPTFGAR